MRVVDVGAQRVQRHLAVVVLLGPRDFGAAETTRDHDLHAARAGLHGPHDRLLHGAAKGDALLELVDDVLPDQTRVELGMLDLDDVDLHVLLGQALEALADVLDADAALADDDAGLGGVDDDAGLIGAALDLDARNRRSTRQAAEVFADRLILMQPSAVVLLFEPAAVPSPGDPEAQADGMNLLSH